MSYIPDDAKWWIADLIVEIKVQKEHPNVVHRNTVLIGAKSPNEAYKKALQLGREGNISYENPNGNKVVQRFRGIAHLDVIPDDLEHGCELVFTEKKKVSESKILKSLKRKKQLEAFLPPPYKRWKSIPKPNYAPAGILKEVIARGGELPNRLGIGSDGRTRKGRQKKR